MSSRPVIISIGIIFLYFMLNALIIRKFHKKQDSLEEYSVGNRSFGWALTCFSYLGSWHVGLVYTGWFSSAADLGVFAQYSVLYSIGSLVVLYLMARPVWIWGKVFNLETQGDLIELRYGSKKFKFIFAALIFLFWFHWLVIEMKTVGYVISAATYQAINFDLGLIIASLFVIVYCFYGGVRATAIGSIVQSITFIFIGAFLIYYLIRQAYGGVIPLFAKVQSNRPELLTLQGEFCESMWTSGILTGILGAFCWPDVFNRIYIADSPKSVKKIVYIAPIAEVVIGLFAVLLGLGGRLIHEFPADAQFGLFWLGYRFAGPIGLALIGIIALAACMSTIATITNTAAVLIAKDLMGFIKRMSRAEMLKYAKISTIIVGLLSIWVATIPLPNLVFLDMIMYNCVVQAIVPLLIGQYWRKGNLYGATVGMFIGIAISLYTVFCPQSIAWANGWSGGLIGLGVNLVVYIILGIVLPKQKHVDEIFEIMDQY